MRNLKVRYKMLIGFGIIIILLIIMNGFSLYNLRSTSNMVGELYDGPHMNTMAAVALMKDFYQMDTGVKGLILGLDTDSSSYDAARKSAEQNMKEIAAQGILTTEKQNAIQSALSQLDSSYNKIKGTAGTSGQQALSELQQVYEPLMKTALVAVQDAASGANQEAQLFRENTIERTNINILLQDIMFVVIVVCSLIVALRMAADISLPLRRLGREMDKIAEGNFNVELNNPYNDEMGIFTRQLSDTINRIKDYINDISYVLGEISGGNIAIELTREYVGDFGAIRESLNQIIQSLNGTMDQIRKCCDEVKTGASSLADSSQSLARGSAQQSDAVEGFQVNLNTVASLTAGDGVNADKVNVLSIKTNEAVNHSDEQMSEMMRAMDGINASSAEIAKIIKIIEDIAFQTNILALNAAVEAARAGTAGKGFAVVADEVRNLASKSAEASKNTSQLIQASMSAVEKGTLIADAAAESLREVGANVRSMSGYLEAIDKSTVRQAEAFDQMLHLSEEITQVVHTNSSAAEENSAASEELSAQARLLDQLVNRFKLSNS